MSRNNNQNNNKENNLFIEHGKLIPYHFVTNDVEYGYKDIPVWHDGSHQEELLSGEIQCTMTALTPLIAGNYSYKVEEASEELKEILKNQYDPVKDKTIIEPLRLKDGR